MRSMRACCTRLGTGKPVSHEVRLATWRFAYDTKQNSSDMPRSERRQEINARPESGGYPKGDAEVDTEHNSDFHQALTQGVDWRMRDSEHDSDFHQALTQGVDWRMRDSEHERVKRSSDER